MRGDALTTMSSESVHEPLLEALLQARTISDIEVSPLGELVAYGETRLELSDRTRQSVLCIGQLDDRAPLNPMTIVESPVVFRWAPVGEVLAVFQRRETGGIGLCLINLRDWRKPVISYCSELFSSVGSLIWDATGDQLAFSAVPLSEIQLTDQPQIIVNAHHKADEPVQPHSLYRFSWADSRLQRLTEGAQHDSNPTWSPCGQYLAFVREGASCKNFSATSLWQVKLAGGQCQPIYHDGYHAGSPAWSPDGQTIAYFAADRQLLGEDEQFFRLWLFNLAEGKSTCLTQNHDISVVRQGRPTETPPPLWDAHGQRLFFRVSYRGSICVACFQLGTGGLQRLTPDTAQVFSFSLDRTAEQLVYVASDCYHPVRLFQQTVATGTQRLLLDPNQGTLTLLENIDVSRQVFQSPQGYSIEGWLLSSRCHAPPFPLLLDIHGGPHGFEGYRISLSRSYRYSLVEQGWAVLILNPTGSASYGQAFFEAIRGHWGEYDLPEHLAAIDTLIAQGLVNPDKLAISGYSYGGYMTAWMIAHCDRFKAASVGAPITNLESFYGTSDIGPWFLPSEMQEDVLSINKNCRRLSPIHLIKTVTTPTLILHGENDKRCPISQSEELFMRLLQAGRVPVAMIRYPNASHLFLSKGPVEHKLDYCLRLIAWVNKYINP